MDDRSFRSWAILAIILSATFAFADHVQLVPSSDPYLGEKWQFRDSRSVPPITALKEVVPNQSFYVYLLLDQVGTRYNKEADVHFKLTVRGPDGEIWHQTGDLSAIKGRLRNQANFYLAQTTPDFSFSSSDPLGAYHIDAQIYDEVLLAASNVTVTVHLVPFMEGLGFTDQTLTMWMDHYYRNPQPERALDAFLQYANGYMGRDNERLYPTLVFFLNIFNENPFLVPPLIEAYHDGNERLKTYIAFLLNYSRYDPQCYLDTEQVPASRILRQLADKPFPNAYDLSAVEHVDMLWAAFFATGRYRPVEVLVSALAYHEHELLADRMVLGEVSADQEAEIVKGKIFKEVLWTLENNCARHRQIHDYCRYMFKYGDLDPGVRDRLGAILQRLAWR